MGNKITLIVLLSIAGIAAIFLGSTIGQARFIDLSLYGLVVAAALYILYFYRYTWQIVLLLTWSGVRLNYGFNLTSVHYSMVFLVVYGVLITLLRRNPYRSPDLFVTAKILRLRILLGALLLFGVVSFTFNVIFPHTGGEYAIKNMLKAYSDAFGPSLILIVALTIPYSFKIGKGVLRTILIILFLSCIINMAHLVYLFKQGYGATGPQLGNEEPVGAFFIPIINATFGVYTLRGVGPISVLISFALICYPGWLRAQTLALRLITPGVFMLGLAGSVMSGGRAAVLLCLMYVGIIALVQRRMVLIFGAMCMGMLVVVFANLFSSYLNEKLPMFVSRPLQYVMIEKGDAMDSIEHSSDYRSELFHAGIEEWRSHPRILVMGRSVYVAPDMSEEIAYLGNLGAFVSVGLKTAACHALLPSVLVQYGLIGALIYYSLYVALIFAFWKIYKKSQSEVYSNEVRILSFLMTLMTGLTILVATIGGNFFGILEVVMLILIKSMAARDERDYQNKLEDSESAEDLSPIRSN